MIALAAHATKGKGRERHIERLCGLHAYVDFFFRCFLIIVPGVSRWIFFSSAEGAGLSGPAGLRWIPALEVLEGDRRQGERVPELRDDVRLTEDARHFNVDRPS